MHNAQSLYLLGDTAPAEQFARIARTIPAPRPVALPATESANAASLAVRAEVDASNAVARRALGANGFGDASLNPAIDATGVDSHAVHAQVRMHRARAIGDAFVSVLRSALVLLRAWRERYRRHVNAQGIYRELAGLDSRTLRDLGIHHRGELRFIAQRLAHGEDLHEFNGQR